MRDSAKFCGPIFEREERSKLHVSSFEREFLRAIDFLRKREKIYERLSSFER